MTAIGAVSFLPSSSCFAVAYPQLKAGDSVWIQTFSSSGNSPFIGAKVTKIGCSDVAGLMPSDQAAKFYTLDVSLKSSWYTAGIGIVAPGMSKTPTGPRIDVNGDGVDETLSLCFSQEGINLSASSNNTVVWKDYVQLDYDVVPDCKEEVIDAIEPNKFKSLILGTWFCVAGCEVPEVSFEETEGKLTFNSWLHDRPFDVRRPWRIDNSHLVIEEVGSKAEYEIKKIDARSMELFSADKKIPVIFSRRKPAGK